ncbi:gem-associated protein 8 [Ornithorhynchus anatinus]|uniref:Gem nuclear organelle associated protein 8 n=1 Tax=Ornithorhynchus anatinus TaxID=9258 RepID=F7E8F6_ORNAN|nr:gem-associated protein 8 [Ornithorhynchus anatinus]
MADSSFRDGEPWYSRPVYARFWQHYSQAMHWMHRHKIAYRKAIESFYSLPSHRPEPPPSGRYADWSGDDLPAPGWPRKSGHLHWSGPRPDTGRDCQGTTEEDRGSTTEEESESDGEIECDLSNMEITEELRQYFAETERHREELRRQQQLEADSQDVYVEADHDLHLPTRRSVQPPAERPGERRMAEMKKLYGDSAAKILAMETAMQLNFDKGCDQKQPKYWPVIPLKL